MAERLFISYLAQAAQPCLWALLRDTGEVIQAPNLGTWDDVKSLQQQREVVVVLPGTLITRLTTHIPSNNTQQLLQAVPYAIEDQLASNLDSVHFAVQVASEQAGQIVYVVEKQVMQGICTELSNNGIEVDYFCTDHQLLAAAQPAATLVVYRDLVTCYLSSEQIFSLDKNSFLATIAQLDWPETYALKGDVDANFIAALPGKAEQQPESAFTYLCQQFSPAQITNLYQPGCRQAQTTAATYLMPIAVASLAAVLVLAPLILLAEHMLLKRQVRHGDAAIAKYYQQVFPQARSVVSPRLRIQRELALRQQQQISSHVQQLLAHVSNVVAQHSQVRVEEINYQAPNLTLQCSAKRQQDLQKMLAQLEQAGLQTTTLASDSNAERASLRLRIKGGMS